MIDVSLSESEILSSYQPSIGARADRHGRSLVIRAAGETLMQDVGALDDHRRRYGDGIVRYVLAELGIRHRRRWRDDKSRPEGAGAEETDDDGEGGTPGMSLAFSCGTRDWGLLFLN